VHVAVLELLADGARSLRRARGLDGDDFDEVGDAADVVLLVGLRRERLDGDRDGGVGLLLEWALAEDLGS
jgi:DNA mismatch repair protein MutH